MSESIIVFETTEQYTRSFIKDNFEYLPEKGFAPLQRMAFWFLGKIGCHVGMTTTAYSQHEINTGKLIEDICTVREEARRFSDKCEQHIFMGNEEYHELTGNYDFRSIVSFPCESSGRYGSAMGMKITVVPWMKGILVVPEDIL